MFTYKHYHSSSASVLILRLAQILQTTASALIAIAIFVNSSGFANAVERSSNKKQVLGPTAVVEEAESDFHFPARVDTGATTSSLHVEDCKIEGEASKMTENVGKTIRFKIKNERGESEWLERKIAEISTIKTSEREEIRYKVPVTLNCNDVKKRVLVSLNDRSHMAYPVLLGRNFLQGDFVVDVDLDKVALDKVALDKANGEPSKAAPKKQAGGPMHSKQKTKTNSPGK